MNKQDLADMLFWHKNSLIWCQNNIQSFHISLLLNSHFDRVWLQFDELHSERDKVIFVEILKRKMIKYEQIQNN